MRKIEGCSVSVIGGCGFLGSHLVDHLIEDRGCAVLVVDNLVAGRREFVHPKAEFVHHDITGSEDYLRRLLTDRKVRFVFNYSARPYVPDSYARPLRTFDVNAMGALKVINAAQEAGCEGILQVSSAEVYGELPPSVFDAHGNPASGNDKITEDCPVIPHSTYGASKAAIDALCQVRWRESQTPVIALRQFNCVGERETHQYVVPEIISQLAAQKPGDRKTWAAPNPPIVHLGNNTFRDFLYAGDAVRIAVELLERGQFGEVYNSGSEAGISIYNLARLIGRLMGFDEVEIVPDQARMRPWDIAHLQSDNSKLWGVVDRWELTPLAEALRRTISWFERNGRKWPWEK